VRQIGAQLRGTRVARRRPRSHDEVDGRQVVLAEAENFAHQAPNAVARGRVTDAARGDRQPEPRPAERIGARDDLEVGLIVSLPALVDMLELRLITEALAGAERERPDRNSAAARYGVRRLRPFARRRLNTCRPFLVAMRARKP
jgi:hypothetical protein